MVMSDYRRRKPTTTKTVKTVDSCKRLSSVVSIAENTHNSTIIAVTVMMHWYICVSLDLLHGTYTPTSVPQF